MASTAAAQNPNPTVETPTSGGGISNSSRHAPSTYWCHECDGSVTLLRSTPPLVCPQCSGAFLEEMELQIPPNPSSPPPQLQPQPLTLTDSDDDLYFHPDATHPHHHRPSDRTFTPHVYNEVFDRLIGGIVFAEDHGDLLAAPPGPTPASKSSVEAMPTVKITDSFLAADPLLLCAVCKDEFALGSETRQLPCRHFYHSDCILPWLSQHNSCPVCRFKLPTDGRYMLEGHRLVVEEARRHMFGLPERMLATLYTSAASPTLIQLPTDDRVHPRLRRGDGAAASATFGNLMEEDRLVEEEEEEDDRPEFRRMTRDLLRRHMFGISQTMLATLDRPAASPTRMDQAEVGAVWPANSGESVLSGWPVAGGSDAGGTSVGGGEARVDDEGSVVMPPDNSRCFFD